MYFAQIKNNIVDNVIVADLDFIANQSDIYIECEVDAITQPDDTKIARIGEAYIDGKFINGNQAVELGYLTVDEVINYGFHSGNEYIEPIEVNPHPSGANTMQTSDNTIQEVEL